MARLIAPVVLALLAFGASAQTPLAADVRQGRLCKALAPANWSFTPQLVGLALYQAFPMPNDGFVLVMRTAAATPAVWQRDATLASAVSRSIRCNVPFKPSTFDYTTGLSASGKSRRGKEDRSDYSRWSGMENVHDPATGQNYWVEAGRDWRENGPRGPGYYANVNGEARLLAPGRSD